MFTILYQYHLYFFSPYIRFCCGLPTGTFLYLDKIAYESISYSKSAIRTRAASLTVRPSSEIPLPILTSTPIASKTASNHPPSGTYQTIGKALAHGVPSQIANAIMKNPKSLKRHAKSGKHSEPCKEKDLHELIKRAEEINECLSRKSRTLL